MPIRNYFPKEISITGKKSFSEYFVEVIGQFENEIALIDPEMMKFINYSDLINQTKQMSNALIRLGVQHGDIIGTCAGNSADYIIFVLAALSLGAILVPLNPAYKYYEIETYFKKVSVKWILTEEKLVEKIQHVNEKIIHAMIFFSSGTTGPPKGILLSHQTLLANVELIRKASTISCDQYEMVHLDGTDVVYGVLPYFHAGGLLTVFSLLGLGTRIIVNRKFDNEQFLRVLRNYQVTTILLVPTVLKFLAFCPNLNPQIFHSLKYIFVGSMHVQKSLIKMIEQRLPKTNIIQLYGTTETGAFVFMQPLFSREKIGSCGVLLPNVECKIMKSFNDDKECEEMEIGEIWLKTTTMMKGYLENVTDNISDTFTDGWYRTGDLGYYDFDHFIYITGRIKEMIKVRGWQVSPYEIEETIQELKDVEVCAVVGIPDDYSGQLPKAYIKLHDGAQTDKNTIHQLINTKFASYKQLKGGIQFINNIPFTSTGKIARSELAKMNQESDIT